MPRAPSIPAAERRAHAVRALLELAWATAPDEISTAAIAERMGVSHAALFRHFPTREALWTEAVRWATGELDRRFEAIAAQRLPDPLEEVEALLAAHAEMVSARPGLLRMLFAELQRPATSPAREEGKAFTQRFRQRLAALIGQARDRGAVSAEVDPVELAALVVALYQGLMLQGLVHDSLDQLGQRIRPALRLLLSGVRR